VALAPEIDPRLAVLHAIGDAERQQGAATTEWIGTATGLAPGALAEALDSVHREGFVRGQIVVGSLLGHAQLLIAGREHLRRHSPPNDPVVRWLVERDVAVLRALNASPELRNKPDPNVIAEVAGLTIHDTPIAIDVLEQAGFLDGPVARSPLMLGAFATDRLRLTEAGRQMLQQESPESQRCVLTLLFTDIVGSTDYAATHGDAAWASIVERHNVLVRSLLDQFNGVEVDTAGDGFLCTFVTPSSAINCALAITDQVASLGIGVRAGIHTAECSLVGYKPRGIGVNIASRVMAKAGAGEVLVSSTVRGLLTESEHQFEECGAHTLKGVPGQWILYRAT
jgi:class 3 adenylate cyclase